MPENDFAVNGGVEDGITSWGARGSVVTQSFADSRTGSASALIVDRTANWHGITVNVNPLTDGNEYDVAVWVKLAAGEPDSVIYLTGKKIDDDDDTTYDEYVRVSTITATAGEWTLLQGYYTHIETTPFQYFVIESESETVSYYADDFSIGGQVTDVVIPDFGFFVGNITTNGNVRSDFMDFWDQLTPENEGKWGSIEGTRDVYNWDGMDRAYAYAVANNIPFKAHTFVWGSQAPNWIGGLSATEQAEEIEEWIKDYCARYPATAMIDVVNEAVPGHAPATFAENAFGSDWIIRSFELARQYCPNATLILNDYNVLIWNTDEFLAMAQPVVDAGVVDAIGVQAHGLETMTAGDLQSALNRIASLGLPIYVSEYDINIADDQEQLGIMQEQFPVFFDHSAVAGITFWGYVVGATWRDNTGLIYDDGSQRPAMTWLMDYLGR